MVKKVFTKIDPKAADAFVGGVQTPPAEAPKQPQEPPKDQPNGVVATETPKAPEDDLELQEATQRLTLEIPMSLHTRIKIDCVTRKKKMKDEVMKLLLERWPEKQGA